MSHPRLKRRGRQGRPAAAATALVAATTAVMMAASAMPAFAATHTKPSNSTAVTLPVWGSRLDQIKRKAADLISDRLVSLTKEITEVGAKSYLGGDGASLATEMQADISGLQALGAKIAADTTVKDARADSDTIFTGFRVYLLVLPAAGDVVRVDYMTNVQEPYIGKVISFLQANESPGNQAVIGPLVANMQAQVQILVSATSGLSGQLLGFTAAQWDANHGLLNGPAQQLRIAERAVSAAIRDGQTAYRYLEHHHVPPTTSTTAGATTTTSTPSTTTTSTTPTTTASTTTTTNDELADIQASAARMIDRRVASLDATIKWVQRESYLGADQATLVAAMSGVVTGLQTLGAKIAADTTVAQARADSDLIVSGFRTYDLIIPVAHLVRAVDYIVNVRVPAISSEVSYLQGREGPATQGVLVPIVANMQSQLQVTANATNGLSAQLLGYTASQWDSNHRLLSGAGTDVYISQRALQSAQKDYQRAIAYLHRLTERHHHH